MFPCERRLTQTGRISGAREEKKRRTRETGRGRSCPGRCRWRETQERRRNRSQKTHQSAETVEKGEIGPPRQALAATTLEGRGLIRSKNCHHRKTSRKRRQGQDKRREGNRATNNTPYQLLLPPLIQ
ncbi:hypothetical protein NDU88_002996 [Pleurodeles waltl]|uniref:Uncharacterized protein n=1 Tax=Pleurodeles waltl TaxID=8319 RepID=A0AAV7UX81_PLEWA|nr:hypothetical protein NDU88_002996 [Pleurodeles waltl]